VGSVGVAATDELPFYAAGRDKLRGAGERPA